MPSVAMGLGAVLSQQETSLFLWLTLWSLRHKGKSLLLLLLDCWKLLKDFFNLLKFLFILIAILLNSTKEVLTFAFILKGPTESCKEQHQYFQGLQSGLDVRITENLAIAGTGYIPESDAQGGAQTSVFLDSLTRAICIELRTMNWV